MAFMPVVSVDLVGGLPKPHSQYYLYCLKFKVKVESRFSKVFIVIGFQSSTKHPT